MRCPALPAGLFIVKIDVKINFFVSLILIGREGVQHCRDAFL
jgi:hypothetical protein